jgi:hypothetical protein
MRVKEYVGHMNFGFHENYNGLAHVTVGKAKRKWRNEI